MKKCVTTSRNVKVARDGAVNINYAFFFFCVALDAHTCHVTLGYFEQTAMPVVDLNDWVNWSTVCFRPACYVLFLFFKAPILCKLSLLEISVPREWLIMSEILKSKNNRENLHINFGKRNIYAHLFK